MKINNKKILLFIFAVMSLLIVMVFYFRPQKSSFGSKSTIPKSAASFHTNNKLSMNQLTSMLNKKATFTVMFYETSCPPCQKELKDLKTTNYIKKLYLVNLDKTENIDNKSFKKLNIQYTPTILKIYKGKVVYRHEGYASISLLKKIRLDDFSEYRKRNSITTFWKPISRKRFDLLRAKKSSFIVYLGKSTCKDCQSFERNLQEYDFNSYKNKIYYLNITKYLFNSKLEWQNFKKDNKIAGIPAFISYRRGKYFSSSSWSISNGYSPEIALSWLKKQGLTDKDK
ncbi:thioredoxin family protein [Lactobacillus xylocopicola]|uniref:Thioredoxin-like fold domain-containing protein n=1 Tax=Lactobacillus xylocopicola TaxID=2976676 RepID=A0ABN6SI17_9LACO|nr:thioredoxin family protein [Lactobacillus xylocopicola]BDR59948.1 hypothetical protein KIM322_02090 [Lactobacillus xylocopicola]